MAKSKIAVPGFGDVSGDGPIVILGPNGSGKTQLAQKIASSNDVTAISAQRRTWLDDNLPVQEDSQLRNYVRQHENRWRSEAWQPTEEINFVLSSLVQDHTNVLTRRNEEALIAGKALEPVSDTKLIQLQSLWNK